MSAHTMAECQETSPKASSVAAPAEKCHVRLGFQVDILKKILPAAGGSFIEWYDFAMYGYLTPYITANFFADGRGGSMATWSGFAITFLARPVGGAFFGWLADNFGRKPAMQLTIAIMLFTTVMQGCLPTFPCCGEGWGWFGLAALLILRALQGLSAGGELSTAAVYITEVSPPDTLGVNLSWISITGAFGSWAVAALVVFALEASLGKEAMAAWGWRIPYLTTIFPGGVLIVFRRFMEETEDFKDLVQIEVDRQSGVQQTEEGRTSQPSEARPSPIQDLLANYKLALTIGSLGTAGVGALWFVPGVYGVQFMQKYDDLPETAVTLSEMLVWLIPTVLALAVGRLIDIFGAAKVYILALVAGGVVAPIPLFYWWTHTPQDKAVMSIYLGQVILGFLISLTPSVYLWLVELFPVRVRVTGVSVAYNIGVGIFGGFGPLISDAGNLIISPKSLVSAPAAFTMLTSLMSLCAILCSFILARRGHLRLTHIRDSPY